MDSINWLFVILQAMKQINFFKFNNKNIIIEALFWTSVCLLEFLLDYW